MLDVVDLRQTYADGTEALRGVSLSAPPGLFGLLGPNGAGKSTLMRTLATLQRPTGGGARLGDIDILAEPERLRRVLGYLPQDFGVYPGVGARALLDHMAVLKGVGPAAVRREQVEGLLAQVNLWPVRDRPLADLSGGMRQRFGIAQALLGDPRLVIVDEPTAGLDPEERNRCLDLLASIGPHVVVILSTHIVADVADLCSRMAVLAGGRVVAAGAPDDIVATTEGRIWSRAVNRADLPRLEAEYRVISRRLVGGRTVVSVLADQAPPGFAPAAPGLEPAYFAALAEAGG